MGNVQERVVKDVSSLHWFLKNNISKDEEYTKYQTILHKGMTYCGRLFSNCNSITTMDFERCCFSKYAVVENNKVLRLTYKWGKSKEEEDFTVLVHELFSNASDFMVRKVEEAGREKIEILDGTGKNICSDNEFLSRYGQKDFRNYSRLVDIVRIITLDDVHETVMEILEDKEEKEEPVRDGENDYSSRITPHQKKIVKTYPNQRNNDRNNDKR